MARIYSNGFELNSIASGIEFTTQGSFTDLSQSVQTSIVRSGTYAHNFHPSGQLSYFNQNFFSSDTAAKVYVRFYLYIDTAPSVNSEFLRFQTSSNGRAGGFTLRSDLKVALTSSAGMGIGSTSSFAFATGQWYRVEFMQDATTNPGSLELRVDGTTILNGSNTNQGSWSKLALGFVAFCSANVYIDDVAINDTSGTYQNSWPGEGKLIALRPNAAGDSDGFVRQGTDSGANYSQVNEITPDDINQYVNSTTLNAEDLYGLDASGLSAGDSIHVVTVNLRYRGNVSSGNPTFVPEIKAPSGTMTQGDALTPTSSTWMTNLATYLTPPLTMYVDPDGSTWSASTLDGMQAGFKITGDGANRDDISTVWVYVDYTPGTASGSSSPSVKSSGAFVGTTTRLKVSGSFVEATVKHKVDGEWSTLD